MKIWPIVKDHSKVHNIQQKVIYQLLRALLLTKASSYTHL